MAVLVSRRGVPRTPIGSQAVRRRGERKPGRPVVHVVECSRWQCERHAAEIEHVFGVEARPWTLDEHEEAPEGDVIATYFHYNDIRARWPERLRDVRFVTIQPDEGVRHQLESLRRGRGRMRVLVVERDPVTAENVAADFSVTLPGDRFEVVAAHGSPSRGLSRLGDREAALFPPRVWGEMTSAQRSHERALEARYVIEPGELRALGAEMGRPARGQGVTA